jgi:hypothetical protein
VVELLLEKEADITVASNGRRTPLHAASGSGHLDVVKLLLEKDADITVTNSGGWAPLHAASDKGHLDDLKILVGKAPWRMQSVESLGTHLARLHGEVMMRLERYWVARTPKSTRMVEILRDRLLFALLHEVHISTLSNF